MKKIRRSAFSFVELLIVIGIIVVLMAILLPALNQARAFANRDRCADNLRQLLMATQEYVMNDPENRFPIVNWGPSGTYDPGPAQAGWLYDYPHVGLTENDMQTGLLWKYVNNVAVYHCPLHIAPYINGGTENITSYIMNGAVCSYGGMPHPSEQLTWSLHSFRNPSNQIILFECDASGGQIQGGATGGPIYWNDGGSYPSEVTLSTRHGRGCNMGYFDFHVEFYDLNQFQADLAINQGPLWCNPNSSSGH